MPINEATCQQNVPKLEKIPPNKNIQKIQQYVKNTKITNYLPKLPQFCNNLPHLYLQVFSDDTSSDKGLVSSPKMVQFEMFNFIGKTVK